MPQISNATLRRFSVVALTVTFGCAGEISRPEEGSSSGATGGDVAWTVGSNRAPLGVVGKPIIDTATGPVIGDELLVRFVPGLTETEQQAVAGQVAGLIIYRGPRTAYAVVRFASVAAAAAAESQLRADGRIIDVLRNHICEGTGVDTSPTFELGRQQWNLYAMSIDPFAHNHTTDGVVVAVLDTGAAYEDFSDALHDYMQAPDLEGVTFAQGYDFINDDAHPNDDQRHGTHITGVIAAAQGIQAMAEGTTILPVKVLDGGNSGTELALAEGLVFAADAGAQIANMSLSFPPTYFPSQLMQAAIDYASTSGVIMIAAAGNHDEGLVAYPAAFRDVIAVGASDLPEDHTVTACSGRGHGPGECAANGNGMWGSTIRDLRRAPYSNHGYKIDVIAPAGTITGDANGDGNPEAVLAQTFAVGDPTDFDYYFYSGTSQAAAEVSGLAARMLFENPDLDAHTVRAILGERALADGKAVLTQDAGRGFVNAQKSIDVADHPHADDPRPRFFANVTVTLHDVSGGVEARATVEILDAEAQPVGGMTVYGMWSGAAFAQVVGVTNSDGLVTFVSEPLSGNYVVAFQVDAVSKKLHGNTVVFDRPLGFLRIDSLSLSLLSAFGSGVDTSPTGVDTSPTGASPLPWWVPRGAGVDTSPTIPLPSDPGFAPLTIAFDPALFAGTGYRATLLLPNFSWGLATSPMAVAVDEAWFLATFPGAAEGRVLSFGRGVGDSGLFFTAEGSFPSPLEPAGGDRLALIILTFTSGVDTSPTSIANSGGAGSIIVERRYSGLDAVLADSYQDLIDGWYAAAAGVDTSPTFTAGNYPFSEEMFAYLTLITNRYLAFAPLAVSRPVARYMDTLAAASMPMAPVSPAPDGSGVGAASFAP